MVLCVKAMVIYIHTTSFNNEILTYMEIIFWSQYVNPERL